MAQQKKPAELYKTKWITDSAWQCGVLGAVSVIAVAYYYHTTAVFSSGLTPWGFSLAQGRVDTTLFALLFVVCVMAVFEVIRVWRFYGSGFIQIDPLIKAKKTGRFLLRCLTIYCELLLLYWLIIKFFHSAGEYGFAQQAIYYQPWFRLMDILWSVFVWAGLPYIVITRAFKHNQDSDAKDASRLVEYCIFRFVLNFFKTNRKEKTTFDADLKRAALGLLVKVFFTPIMTVFFYDQFATLVSNVDYIFNGLAQQLAEGTYRHYLLNKDFVNISMSLIFSIDVAVAWCGYVVSSRWLDNQTFSAEPTLLGWSVCLLSYPPFRVITGWFFSGPGDQLFLSLPSQNAITVFAVMMSASYLVYMLSTLCFGIRFSNLTHRGIIRRGPFALVRHPAYAAKNFGWWCVGFPVVIYNLGTTGFSFAFLMFLGLCLNTWIYYLRAITEERHLSMDPRYVEYCRHVPYRFIPGLV